MCSRHWACWLQSGIKVKQGERVQAGCVLGLSGNSGYTVASLLVDFRVTEAAKASALCSSDVWHCNQLLLWQILIRAAPSLPRSHWSRLAYVHPGALAALPNLAPVTCGRQNPVAFSGDASDTNLFFCELPNVCYGPDGPISDHFEGETDECGLWQGEFGSLLECLWVASVSADYQQLTALCKWL